MTIYSELDIQVSNTIAAASWANNVRTNQQHFRERRKYYTAQVVPPLGSTETGDGKHYFDIPSQIDGMNLVEIAAFVITAGTTNTLDVQVHNLTTAQDMLSTVLTIDSGDTHSDDATIPAVIDTGQDGVSESDIIRVDVDALHDTPAKGLIVRLGFANP
jgi:hypothetical protein